MSRWHADSASSLSAAPLEGVWKSMRILVVEDEKNLANFLRECLSRSGFEVETVGNAESALRATSAFAYDAVILDLVLPGRDGLSILRELRQGKLGVPVLILSGKGELDDRLTGLNLGADDYLPKPFAVAELVARLRALQRRTWTPPGSTHVVADLELHLTRREVRRGGQRIDLSPREFTLLEYLMRHADQAISRNEIGRQIWGDEWNPDGNLVAVYIQRLRRKVDEGHANPLLRTVPGGYCLSNRPHGPKVA